MKHQLRNRQPPLVLIAEDEGEIADILGAYLARSGLRSARAAVEQARAQRDVHRLAGQAVEGLAAVSGGEDVLVGAAALGPVDLDGAGLADPQPGAAGK